MTFEREHMGILILLLFLFLMMAFLMIFVIYTGIEDYYFTDDEIESCLNNGFKWHEAESIWTDSSYCYDTTENGAIIMLYESGDKWVVSHG